MRAPELIAAVTFACANLKDPGDLFKGAAALPLAAIDDALPEGKTLLASARRILADIGKADVTVDLPRGRRRSGPDLRRHRLQRRRRHHRGGRRGRRHPRADRRDRRQHRHAWPIAPASPASTARSSTRSSPKRAPTAPGTPGARRARPTSFPSAPNERPSAAAAVAAVKPKVDDYFGRCRLAAFDPRALPAINRNAGGVPSNRGRRT